MKTLLVIFSLIIILLISSFVISPGGTSTTSKYITVKVVQGSSKSPIIITAYPDNRTEITELEIASSAKDHEKNTITLNNVLNKISGEGHKLIASNGGDFYAHYIFEE